MKTIFYISGTIYIQKVLLALLKTPKSHNFSINFKLNELPLFLSFEASRKCYFILRHPVERFMKIFLVKAKWPNKCFISFSFLCVKAKEQWNNFYAGLEKEISFSLNTYFACQFTNAIWSSYKCFETILYCLLSFFNFISAC